MRKTILNVAVLASTLAFAGTALALEKTSMRMTDDTRSTGWTAGTTCSVSYYNTCTGWIWVWSGWNPEDRVGVTFDNCCASGSTLDTNFLFAWDGAPSGYGFTGTIEVYDADPSGCPTGPALASQPFLPAQGWNQFVWGVPVGSMFTIVATHGATAGTPISYPSDHPAIGNTGPQACGTCFPVTRENRTFYLGTTTSPLCPGSSMFDGVCDAQFLFDAQLGNCAVAVEDASWGQIKNLYR